MKASQETWGAEIVWADTKNYSARVLHINEGEKLPYIYHKRQDITLLISQGVVQLVIEGRSKMLNPSDTYHIPHKLMHQIIAFKGDAIIIEVGTRLEDDVVIVKQ